MLANPQRTSTSENETNGKDEEREEEINRLSK
jgi:hypothetical protein